MVGSVLSVDWSSVLYAKRNVTTKLAARSEARSEGGGPAGCGVCSAGVGRGERHAVAGWRRRWRQSARGRHRSRTHARAAPGHSRSHTCSSRAICRTERYYSVSCSGGSVVLCSECSAGGMLVQGGAGRGGGACR